MRLGIAHGIKLWKSKKPPKSRIPRLFREAPTRFELVLTELQSAALPLGYGAIYITIILYQSSKYTSIEKYTL